MRILLTVVFIALGLSLSFGLAYVLLLEGTLLSWFLPLATITSCAIGFVVAHYLTEKLRPVAPGLSLAELDSLGLLRRMTYRAVRGFAVEEFEDEGVHYVLELDDGRVMCLNGQYLYDYEPDAYGAALGRPRRFPCTEFALVQHIEKGWTCAIECSGTVLEPEFTARHPNNWQPEFEDDQMISDEPYEQLKSRFSSPDAA